MATVGFSVTCGVSVDGSCDSVDASVVANSTTIWGGSVKGGTPPGPTMTYVVDSGSLLSVDVASVGLTSEVGPLETKMGVDPVDSETDCVGEEVVSSPSVGDGFVSGSIGCGDSVGSTGGLTISIGVSEGIGCGVVTSSTEVEVSGSSVGLTEDSETGADTKSLASGTLVTGEEVA